MKPHGPEEDAADAGAARASAVRKGLMIQAAHVVVVVILFLATDRFLVLEPLMGIAMIPAVLLTSVAAVWIGRSTAPAVLQWVAGLFARPSPRLGVILAGVTGVALLLTATVVLQGFANSSDEYALILQAETLASGRLWVDSPVLPEAFKLLRFIAHQGVWISAYYPGWSAILAVGERLGAPLWSVNPVVGVLLAVAFFVLARRTVQKEWAWIATLSFVASAFFLLNLASFFPHGAAALWGVCFAICGRRYLDRGGVMWALAAGAAIGALGLTRPFNAGIFAAPFVVALLATPMRRLGLIWFGLGGAPLFLLFLGYNAAVTGSPFIPVQGWLQEEPFGASSSAVMFTIWRTARLYLWTSPVLVLGWVAAIAYLAHRRRLAFTDWIYPATVLAFLLYGGDGAVQYGPRYLFEAWPFIILTAAKAFEGAWTEGDPRWRGLLASAVLAHLSYQWGYSVPRIEREHRIINERQSLYHTVERAGLAQAVVFIGGDSGKIRPMPARDLPRNGLKIGDESVTYALDRGAANRDVMALFPDRQYYLYQEGALTRLAPATGAAPAPR